MAERPTRPELLGLVGLGIGFVVFTFGVLAYVGGSQGVTTVERVVAAGFPVVYYAVVELAGK